MRLDPVTGKKIPPPVSPKPIRMTATRLTRANVPKPPPAPPQLSTGVKSAEEELDALTDLLVKNLENTGDPDFFGKFMEIIVDVSCCFEIVQQNIACAERIRAQSQLLLSRLKSVTEEFDRKLFLNFHLSRPFLERD